MSPESQLLVLLCHARLEEPRLTPLLATPLDWPLLTELAAFNRVMPLAVKHLRLLGFDHPALESWRAEEQRIAQANLARRQWTERFLTAMDRENLPVILLKGIGFAEWLYQDPTYKRMNDSDILVRPEDVERCKALLAAEGFVCVTDMFGTSIFPEGSHHCPPYLSPDRRCVVGLHWGLVSPDGPYQPDHAAIWAEARPMPYGSTRAWQMSWEDNLLHLCIHLPFYKTGLRELMDVFNIPLYAGPIHWDRLDAKVKAANAAPAVYRVLSLARALAPFDIPEALLARWKAESPTAIQADVATRCADPDRLLRSRSTHLADIERDQVVFMLSRNFEERLGAWASTWKRLLAPGEAEQERLLGRARNHSSLTGRLRDRAEVTARIWNGLAVDHGTANLLKIVVASPLLLAKNGMRRAQGRDGVRLADHPIAELLEILE